jgi:hypothetical protein
VYPNLRVVAWYNSTVNEVIFLLKNTQEPMQNLSLDMTLYSRGVYPISTYSPLEDNTYYTAIESGYVEEEIQETRIITDNYLQGFSETGRHQRYSGDLNDILWNSTYNFSQADTSNYPSDLETNRWAFITTMVHQVNTEYAVQVCYDMNTLNYNNSYIWMRRRVGGTWYSWDRVLTENTVEKVPIGQFKMEGTGLNISGVGAPALAAMDSTHVAFIDNYGDQLRMYVWNGSTWSLEGVGLDIPGIGIPTLAAMDSTHVAFIDDRNDQLRMYVWNGAAWSLEGAGLSISITGQCVLAAMDSTHVAFADNSIDQLRMYVWNGSTWASEGTSLDIPSITYPALAAMDSTHVAFIDNYDDQLRMYVWNGSAWALEGVGLDIPGIGIHTLAAMDSTHVAFIDDSNDQLRMYVWNGAAWSLEGAGLSISITGQCVLAAMDSTHVAFTNNNVDQLRMYKSAYALW